MSDGGQAGPTRAKARYKLEIELLFDRPTAVRLVLVIKALPGPQLLWTETLHIGEDLDQGRLDDSIGRLGSTLCREVFYAESRRIRSLKDEELGPGELTHLVRQLVGEVSMDSVALARTYLDRAVAMAPWTAEQKILDAYLKVHAVMGSNYTEQDLARLRPWASAAINADPTDWRGCLLAAAVELWLGNAQLAIAHAGAAKKLCPYNAAISGQLGMAYVWSGEPELAAVELDAALAMSLMERRPYLILCNLALVALMRGRLGQALLFCDQAASCIPELGLAHLLKVDVLVALGRGIEAARVYREMIRDRFDDLIAVVRRQRVLADFWVPRAAQALKIAAQAAEQLEQMPLGDAVRRLGSEGSGR